VTDERVTYNQLVDRIVTLASALTKRGVVKGDIVAMYARNSPEYIISVLGILAAGASAAGVNPAYNSGLYTDVTVHLHDAMPPIYYM
jgi:acyl-CoA synthetase (AMP-forming)/AMP-acid ligase II